MDNTTTAASAASCVTRPTTCEGWLAALAHCLTTERRTDGSEHLVLSSASEWDEIREDLVTLVRSAHFQELPNDWRYEVIEGIATMMMQMPDSEEWSVENFREESHAVAESLTDTYTYDLLQWVAGNITRTQWDDSEVANCAEPYGDIVALIKLRQFEEIESMVQCLLLEIEDLLIAA